MSARLAAAAPSARRIGAQAGMELRLTLRHPESLLVSFGLPLGLLLFFALVDVLPLDAGPPVRWLVPAIVALSLMSASMVSLGIATGFERHYLVLKRLGATPLRRSELVAAKMLAVAAVQAAQVAAVVGVALLALGWRPAGGGPWWLAPVALLLGTAAFAGIGLALAGRLPATATLAVLNAGYVALLLLGGVVIPLELLPRAVRAVAALLPAAPLVGLLRAALGETAGPVGAHLAVLAGWAVGAVALAVRLFRWE